MMWPMTQTMRRGLESLNRSSPSPYHAQEFLQRATDICGDISYAAVEALAAEIAAVRQRNGRLFILGVGGSAATASHAVNDFRKLCDIEAYCPCDNVAELTARTNDEGWETVFVRWLEVSRLCEKDAILIFSVGGGDAERNISRNIVYAVDRAKICGAKVLGIVGRDGGDTAKYADAVVIIPWFAVPDWITPMTEAFAGVVLHCLVSHPALQRNKTKW